jgi:hypothetical protein
MEFVMRDNRRDINHDGISAAEMLRKFCEWQSSVNTLDDDSPYHHDTALLLTRYSEYLAAVLPTFFPVTAITARMPVE